MLSLVLGIGTVLSKCFLSLEKSPWFFIAPGHLPPPTCFLCPGDILHMEKQNKTKQDPQASPTQVGSGHRREVGCGWCAELSRHDL